MVFFSHLLLAETHTALIHLETSQCVYIDGRKDCSKNTLPEEELTFNLVKSSSGKYFAFNQVQTYINGEVYKVTFYLTANSREDRELQLRLELISRSTSGNKVAKVKQFLVRRLSDLSNVTVYGEPVIGNTGGYITEIKHGVKFLD